MPLPVDSRRKATRTKGALVRHLRDCRCRRSRRHCVREGSSAYDRDAVGHPKVKTAGALSSNGHPRPRPRRQREPAGRSRLSRPKSPSRTDGARAAASFTSQDTSKDVGGSLLLMPTDAASVIKSPAWHAAPGRLASHLSRPSSFDVRKHVDQRMLPTRRRSCRQGRHTGSHGYVCACLELPKLSCRLSHAPPPCLQN